MRADRNSAGASPPTSTSSRRQRARGLTSSSIRNVRGSSSDDLVARLPEDARPVFVLFELEGMTMVEIASCLDIPPGTVASRLRRAREVFSTFVSRLEARRNRG